MVVGRDNKVVQRILITDRTIGHDWLVTSGLQVGDRVILEGGQAVKPGATVRPVPWRAPVPARGQPDAAGAR